MEETLKFKRLRKILRKIKILREIKLYLNPYLYRYLVYKSHKLFIKDIKGKGITNFDYDDKTILFIFAGRQDRMSLLMAYLKKILQQKKIDYIHIWNFARNEKDFTWLKSLEDKDNNIFVFSPSVFNKKNQSLEKSYAFYKSAYYFYSKSFFSNANFVKCDDDVIFLDVEYFDNFLQKVKDIDKNSEYYMVSANVVNNGVCANIQQNYGAIPKSIETFNMPHCDYYLGGANAKYWDYGEKSQLLHQYFLDNKDSYISSSRTQYSQLVDCGTLFSINFIGFKQTPISYFITDNYNKDENYLTLELSKILQKKILVETSFVVSHLSFHSQLKKQNDKLLLVEYNKLLKNIKT